MTLPTDPAMAQTKAWLCDRNLTYRQMTRYQLKVGPRVSYYPAKGTIFVDGDDGARQRTGLLALEEVLVELGYLRIECPRTLVLPIMPDGH